MIRGEPYSRKSSMAPPTATTTTLAALPAKLPNRADGAITVVLSDFSGWVFDADSTSPAQEGIVVPSAGNGRFIRVFSPVANPGTLKATVAAATTAALAANTRTANVLLADANGALGAIDGVTLIVGDRLLVQDEVIGANNGIYIIDALGAAGSKWQMTRATDFDSDAEVVAGCLMYVDDGTANGNEWFFLSTNDPITVNTTALVFVAVPSYVDLASTATGEGADLIGVYDVNAVVTATAAGPAIIELARRQLAAVADDAALIAITAAQRDDGALVVKLDDLTIWGFDAGSAAAASDWVQVPSAGTGRWLRKDAEPGTMLPSVADNAALVALTAVNRSDGSIVVQLDTMQVWKYDLGSAAAASDWVVAPTDGVGRWLDAANPNGGLILPTVANNAALIALTAVDRQDGSIIVQLDTNQVWKYFIGSAAAASDWVIVPTDGVGRWHDVGYPDGGLMLPPVADNAALIALTATDRQDGSLVVQLDTMQVWKYDLGSTSAASDFTVVPTDGVGRWIDAGNPVASDAKNSVRAVIERPPAYTRTANVILADAVGALGAIDGVTLIVGDRILLVDGAAGADNGIYQVTVIGDGGTAYELTRTVDADTSAKVTCGQSVYVEEGTINAGSTFRLVTNNPITLNTTALVYRTSSVKIREVTITSTELTTAGATQSIVVGAAIPATAMILGYRYRLVDAFDSPGGASLDVQLGDDTTDPDSLCAAFDAYTASAYEGAGWVEGTRGVRPNGTPTGTQLELLFTATVDNLSTFTNGDLDVEISYIDVIGTA